MVTTTTTTTTTTTFAILKLSMMFKHQKTLGKPTNKKQCSKNHQNLGNKKIQESQKPWKDKNKTFFGYSWVDP